MVFPPTSLSQLKYCTDLTSKRLGRLIEIKKFDVEANLMEFVSRLVGVCLVEMNLNLKFQSAQLEIELALLVHR